MNIVSGKEDCMKQLDQWADKIRAQINMTYDQLQLEINFYHRKTEASTDQWKRSLMQRMETKVGCSLQEQLHKDEVEEAEFNGAQTEFELSKELFQSLHNRPIISLSTVTGNQDVLNAPCLVLPNVITDSFGWIEDFPIEDTVSAMEHSHQQQLHIGTDVSHETADGEYNLDSQH